VTFLAVPSTRVAISEPDTPLLNLKARGDLAELMVASDLLRRGHKIAIPYGEDCDFDLILIRGAQLERIQVKYTRSDGAVVNVRCRSHSLTNGKVRQVKQYTAETIDILAVYDATTDRCYYVPASELGSGRSTMLLRLKPARNGQRIGTRRAENYLDP
jgi:PD-(D/E)XK endonuclease